MPERGILVLGAGGFIGRALVARLAERGEPVVAGLRRETAHERGVAIRVTGELSPASDWPGLLSNIRVVVHLASRAHAPPASEAWIEAEAATAAALGAAARRAGVERIVLLSSVKVHGEASGERRFTAADPPAPLDAYGRAKLKAEEALAASGAAFTILRPPLVYGPGVKGNFLILMQLVQRGLPLPLASVANRRSLIFIGNLLDLIETALAAPAAVGRAFLLRDDREAGTPDLVRLIAHGLGRPARLFPCPPGVLRAAAWLLRRSEDAERLLGSLTVDDTETRLRLGWRPRVALDDGIAATCRWFCSEPGAPQRGPGNSVSMRPSKR